MQLGKGEAGGEKEGEGGGGGWACSKGTSHSVMRACLGRGEDCVQVRPARRPGLQDLRCWALLLLRSLPAHTPSLLPGTQG